MSFLENQKNIASAQLLLIVVTLETDKVTNILIALRNLFFSDENNIENETFEYLQVQSALTVVFITVFLLLSMKGLSNEQQKNQEASYWNIITSVFAICLAGNLTVASDLINLENIDSRDSWNIRLFVFLALFVVLMPLLAVFNSVVSAATSLRAYRIAFSGMILCFLFGFFLQFLLEIDQVDIVYKPQAYYGVGIAWYVLALEPIRSGQEWDSSIFKFLYTSVFIIVGFSSGAAYGLFMHGDGAKHHNGWTQFLAVISWGLYGISPVLTYVCVKFSNRVKADSIWIYSACLNVVFLTILNVLLSSAVNYSNYGLKAGLIIGVFMLPILSVTEYFLRGKPKVISHAE